MNARYEPSSVWLEILTCRIPIRHSRRDIERYVEEAKRTKKWIIVLQGVVGLVCMALFFAVLIWYPHSGLATSYFKVVPPLALVASLITWLWMRRRAMTHGRLIQDMILSERPILAHCAHIGVIEVEPDSAAPLAEFVEGEGAAKGETDGGSSPHSSIVPVTTGRGRRNLHLAEIADGAILREWPGPVVAGRYIFIHRIAFWLYAIALLGMAAGTAFMATEAVERNHFLILFTVISSLLIVVSPLWACCSIVRLHRRAYRQFEANQCVACGQALGPPNDQSETVTRICPECGEVFPRVGPLIALSND